LTDPIAVVIAASIAGFASVAVAFITARKGIKSQVLRETRIAVAAHEAEVDAVRQKAISDVQDRLERMANEAELRTKFASDERDAMHQRWVECERAHEETRSEVARMHRELNALREKNTAALALISELQRKMRKKQDSE
jgi:hypothetical protein